MKRMLVSILGVALLATSAWAITPTKEGSIHIELNVLAFVELEIIDGECNITPTSEDYANTGVACENDFMGCASDDLVVNNPGAGPGHNTIKGGFAERASCLEISIFTNTNKGADVYVYGIQPTQQQNILRLEDIYFTIEVEKTYICVNNLEEGCSPTANTCETPKMGACWLKIHNEAQHLISVNKATKAPRNIAIKVGIGNLNRYTEGEYTSDVVVVLMPRV